MYKFWKQDRESLLDYSIDRVVTQLNTTDPGTEEFSKAMVLYQRLVEMRDEERKPRFRIDPNVIVTVLGNLFGIVIIVMYEERHVITSKGLLFIKPKT